MCPHLQHHQRSNASKERATTKPNNTSAWARSYSMQRSESATPPEEINAVTRSRRRRTLHLPDSMLQICRRSATGLRALPNADDNFANVSSRHPNLAPVQDLQLTAWTEGRPAAVRFRNSAQGQRVSVTIVGVRCAEAVNGLSIRRCHCGASHSWRFRLLQEVSGCWPLRLSEERVPDSRCLVT